jgi:sialate O-acetylesterase
MLFLMKLRNLVVLMLCAAPAWCDVRLPAILGSHMVVQRDRPIHIWGWAAPGEKVIIAMHGAERYATADDLGKWSLYLPPEPAGGPYQLDITATNHIILDDILIGDVWFASGQSNMEMPLSGWPGAPLKNSAEEIANANNPNLRLLVVHQKTSEFPLQDVEGSWTLCTPETAAHFSAAAYFFGREIAARENVPVGLIDDTWGGTVVEAWISLDSLSADASLMPAFAARAQMMDRQADVPAITAKEQREDEAARKAGLPPQGHVWNPDPYSWGPAALFNGMVAPCTGFGIKGAIWYQGESNSRPGFAPMYERLFSALIADWRTQWGEGDFPFLFVQIANFTSGPTESWATIREAQRRTLAVERTGMAVTVDIGTPDNVHPPDKQTVGARLALAARALAYGEQVEYSGPLFRQAVPDERSMRVWFDHAAGLTAKNGEPEGFEIAGDDHRFARAEARIDGDTVVVTSSRVGEPRYVRYGWANAPVVNLYNSAGLPASPFTSEKTIPAP